MSGRENKKQEKLTVIVHSPLGVMGDMSGAARTIESIHSQYPKIIIDFVIFTEPKDTDKIKKFIPNCINKVCFIDLPHRKTHLVNGLNQASDILSNTDAILFFATYRFMLGRDDLDSLSCYGKPIMFLSDYDRHIKGFNITVTHNTPICYENIGLGQDELGVFSPLADDCADYSLSKIDTISDMAFRDFLLKTSQSDKQEQIIVQEKRYLEKYDLYLGYFNLIQDKGQTSQNSLGLPVFFVEDCMMRSIKNNRHNIDIVMPLSKADTEKTCGRNIKAIIAHFESLHADKDITVEFYNKTQVGNIKKTNEYGKNKGKTHIRIINGFPFAPKTFQCLLNISEPYCMLTGNQSLIEGIYHNKICLYQIMKWNRRFYHELVRLAATILGSKSVWAMFLALQIVGDNANKVKSHKKITQLLLDYEPQILKEGKVIVTYLENNKNLNDILPAKVIPTLFDQKKYIKKAIMASQYVSFEYLTNLAAMFPESKSYILNYVLELGCFQPFGVLHYLEGESRDRAEAHSLSPDADGEYEIKKFTNIYSELLKSNSKIDEILVENIKKSLVETQDSASLLVLLNNFISYMLSYKSEYIKYYPKFCRTLLSMKL